MAEDFIEEIYSKSQVITMAKKMLEMCRSRRYISFLEQWKKLIGPMADFCREIAQQNEVVGGNLWNTLQTIKREIEGVNYTKVADLLEEAIIYMYEAIGVLGNIDVSEGEYRLFSTKSGFLNVQLGDKVIYSATDPAWDRYELAKSLFIPTVKHFFIVGCGLGYLPWQLYQVANEAADVHVFDTDANMVGFAYNYGVLSYIPEERLKVTVEKDFQKLINKISKLVDRYDESEFVLYIEEYVDYYLTESEKKVMDSLGRTIQTRINFKDIVEQNYYLYHMLVTKNLNDIEFMKCSRQWIVIGAGPSFDENIEYLKSQVGEKTIIAASTIWSRLIEHGIEPDYIAVIDPQKRTYGHMEGIESNKPIMILSEYANWRFAQNYSGERYLVPCQMPYYANHSREDNILEFKGTVTSFAIEIATYAKAESVELLGVDLAFPNGNSHACGTMDFRSMDESLLIKTKAVDGGEVYTSSLFSMYISDIEKQIERHSEVEFYNLSKHGALIRGCKGIQ